MSKCFIVGAIEESFLDFKYSENDLIIAADKGYEILKKRNYPIDLTVGDFDSLGYIPSEDNIILLPKEKDITDTHKAIKIALERGYKEIILTGMLKGRVDHTLANIQELKYLKNQGVDAKIIAPNETLFFLHNEKIELPNLKGTISILAMPTAQNVTIKNLKYEVENINLDDSFPLGISNEFLNKKASIEVLDGYLLIIIKI